MIRQRIIKRAGIGAALSALFAALLLSAAISPQASAQVPDPPHWFWGMNFNSDNGSSLRALNQDGDLVASTSISGGTWSVLIPLSDATSVTFEIQSGDTKRATSALALMMGDVSEVTPAEFSVVEEEESDEPEASGETTGVRVRARVSDNPGREGRIEFAASLADGEPVPPSARYFPEGITHNRWLRSSPITLAEGVVVRVIARISDNQGREGRIEFGLYVDGVDRPIGEYNTGGTPMFLPPARYFPDPQPSHNRWLRSTVVDVPLPR